MTFTPPKFLKDWFTENDGTSWELGRMLGFVASAVMFYKFAKTPTPDFMGFGTGICAVIAAIAAKGYSERKDKAE